MEESFYGRYADWDADHWWFRGRRSIIDAVLQQCYFPQPNGRVLDFGCGPGSMIELLSRYGEVSGVDGSREAVALCHERGLRRVTHLEPGDPLPFPDHSFDLVTAFDVIEHIEDHIGALRELRRVSRPSGTLLVTVPAFMSLWGDQDVVSHHVRRYRRKSLESALELADWQVLRTSYFNTLLFPPIAAVRLSRRVLRPAQAQKTDFDTTPMALDDLLSSIMRAEAPVVARKGLPFGVSLIALASA